MVDEEESPSQGTTADELESEAWNVERDRLEAAAREAALALLVHTHCRACALPFVYNGLAMMLAIGLPVDVLSTTIESMKRFVSKHEDDLTGAMAVLVGVINTADDEDSKEGTETSH